MSWPKKPLSTFSLGLVSIAVLLLLAGCGGTSVGQPNQVSLPKQAHSAAIVLNIDADRYEYNTPANMCHAPMIADVIVGTTGQSHWNTTNEVPPSVLSQSLPANQVKEALFSGGYMIYTPVAFTSMNILFDHRTTKPSSEEFAMVGGQQGTTQVTMAEYPSLQASTRYLVVFTPGLNASTHTLDSQWQLVYNAFPIDAQGMVLLQQAGSPNERGSGQPQPEVKIAFSDLQQQLAACH